MQPKVRPTQVPPISEPCFRVLGRRLRRYAAFLGLVVYYGLGSAGRSQLSRLDWTQRCASLLLRALNFRVDVRGRRLTGPGVLISNHLSYLDAAVLAAIGPSCFVTSREVEQSLLGILCRWAGCLFVERRSPSRARGDRARVAQSASASQVVVFAEGTSTRGAEILPLKAGLLASLPSDTALQPLVLTYSSPKVAYVDDDTFGSHFWDLVGEREIEATVTFLEPRLMQEVFETGLRPALAQIHREMSKVHRPTF